MTSTRVYQSRVEVPEQSIHFLWVVMGNLVILPPGVLARANDMDDSVKSTNYTNWGIALEYLLIDAA